MCLGRSERVPETCESTSPCLLLGKKVGGGQTIGLVYTGGAGVGR